MATLETIGLQSSGQIRYLTTNTTNGSFTLTAGRTLTAPSNMFSLGSAANVRHRGVEITFFGVGSDTNTFDYRVWVVKRCMSTIGGSTVDYDLQLYCHGTATLGPTAGPSATTGVGITSSDKIVDLLTVTMDSYGTAVCNASGAASAQVHAPNDNTEARLFIPDCGNASDIIVEYDMTGATSGNCLIERMV